METTQDILDRALALGEEERALLALRLLDSLAPLDDRDDAEWIAEIETRARRALSGESAAAPLEQALDRIERQLQR